MIWPLAAEYARRGWAVRRVAWSNPITNPFNADTSLRWVVYHHGLFHITYLNRTVSATGANITRVVQNYDFGRDEFLARDWTVYSPQCSTVYAGWDQQGKPPYPTPVDYNPPTYPWTPPGDPAPIACPNVPPIFPPDDPTCGTPCQPPPLCGANYKLATGGFDTCGCRIHICQPLFCPDPPNRRLRHLRLSHSHLPAIVLPRPSRMSAGLHVARQRLQRPWLRELVLRPRRPPALPRSSVVSRRDQAGSQRSRCARMHDLHLPTCLLPRPSGLHAAAGSNRHRTRCGRLRHLRLSDTLPACA